MNFTREPIIETIISSKEGCKLLIRSSKAGSGAEEYFVDAVEVVSFGRAFFFRSMERPKAFLVPVSDYEVLEVKETRVALKNVSHDRNIKIGGGREAPMRHVHREPPQEREPLPSTEDDEEQQPVAEEAGSESTSGRGMDKRRDRRRRRHRRSPEDQDWSERRPQQTDEQKQQPEGEQKAQGGGAEDETKVSSQMFSALIPPPTRLISETLSQYKDKEFMEGAPRKEVEPKERPHKESPPDEKPTGSESTPLNRVSSPLISEHLEIRSISSTHFSPLHGSGDSYFL